MQETSISPIEQEHKATFFEQKLWLRKLIFFGLAALSLSTLISPPIALLAGLLLAQLVGHPYPHLNKKATHSLLQLSVVGLGFGMNVSSALRAGKEGIGFTIASIILTLSLGYLLARLLKIERKTSFLISAGTAICGGSAIAAVSPVIRAEEKQISVALATVFVLNSIALFLFPALGHVLHLSQTQFGLWSAIAIHDTSSVVAAANKYGAKALEVATTVKLARALWIIPVAFLSTLLFKNKGGKVKIPYFIGLFVIAMVLNTYLPAVRILSPYVVNTAKAGLTLTLFLIGSGLSRSSLKSVGMKPLFMAVILWAFISLSSLWAILQLPV